MKKRFWILLNLLWIFSLLPSQVFASSAKEEPVVYVIQKGDTLWGLSERFMKDPYYWPSLWAITAPEIGNPHFIFPGQKLKFYSDHVEVVSPPENGSSPQENRQSVVAPAPATAVKMIEEAAAQERTFTVTGGEGFILEKGDKPLGMIIAGQQNRTILGEDDLVYVDMGRSNGVKVGDRFTIYKKYSPISHPITNLIVGERVVPLGALQLSEVEERVSKALVTRSFMEIEPGAYLGHLKLPRKELALRAADSDLTGTIIETKTGSQAISAGDIAYLDLGKEQGLKIGNLLYVVRDIKIDQQRITGPVMKLPVDVVGALVVVDTGNNSSTVLVVKSIDTIYRGDRVELRKSR